MFTIPIEPVLVYILVLIRVLFLLSFLPVFSDPFAPLRIRLLLALPIAFLFTPLISLDISIFPETIFQFMTLMIPEALLGASMGFIGRLFFGAVQFAGTIIGKEAGFGYATILDPTRTTQTPVVTQVLFIGSILIFLGINGDHVFFEALGRSFQNAPPGYLKVSGDIVGFFNEQATHLFFIAVQLSLPIVTATFILNIGMVMLGKGAPQINVFFERFPLAIILGLSLLSVLSNFIVRYMIMLMGEMENSLDILLRIMGA